MAVFFQFSFFFSILFSTVYLFPKFVTFSLASSIENAWPRISEVTAGIISWDREIDSLMALGKLKSLLNESETFSEPLTGYTRILLYSRCNRVPSLFALRLVSMRFYVGKKVNYMAINYTQHCWTYFNQGFEFCQPRN